MRGIEFVALDCETTGIDSRRDNIIELGAVKFSLAQNLASFDSLFYSPTRIPQFVEQLTGIQNSDLADAPKFPDKKNEIENFLTDSILVGHNLPFDLDFLTTAGLDFSGRTTLDTFLLAGLILPRGESLGLESLAQKFQIFHEDAHRALADAEATRELLRVLTALARNFSAEKWERIRNLNSAKGWPQIFAELVLSSAIPPREFENAPVADSAVRDSVVEKLFTELSGDAKLIEVSAQPNEILAAAEKLNQPSVIFFASNFTARELPAAQFFAPQNYVDAQKLEKFLSKKLTPTELTLAAKLILHSDKNRHELNLTRAENLLFDFVAAEEISASSNSKVLVSDHAAFEFAAAARRRIIADAATFSESRAQAVSLDLDLSNLELLAPAAFDKIQIWWGLLGLLFREAAPQFGRLDFTAASGLANFSKVVEAGQNLLAEISGELPPSVVRALQNFLDPNSNCAKSLRSNVLGEITISIEPRAFLPLDFSKDFLIDSAMDAADDFTFARRQFALPADFPATKTPTENAPRFFVAENAPDPAAPQFFPVVTKFLLTQLPDFSGLTALVFPNRAEAGKFAERATAELTLPIFFRKIPSAENLRALGRAVVILTPGSRLSAADFANYFVIKLPFFVCAGDDWLTQTLPATVLRFKKMWADFARLDSAVNFFALDSRLLGKNYGQNFLDAIPQKFEGVKISA